MNEIQIEKAAHVARRTAAARIARWTGLVALLWCAAVAPALAAETKSAPLSGVVNVNIASPEELQALPGIGETRARAIVAEREQRGGFQTVDELIEVKGIGEGVLVRMRPYVSLSGKSTAAPAD